MNRRKATDAKLFEAVSKHVVKQIDRGSLHPIPDLHSSRQYELLQVLEIQHSRRTWKKPTFAPTGLSLNEVMCECEGATNFPFKRGDADNIFKGVKQPGGPISLDTQTCWCHFGRTDADVSLHSGPTRNKCKMQCDLGPLEAETVHDLNELQRWVSMRNVDYKDPRLKRISEMMEGYLEGKSLGTLCVVTSVYRLTREGRLVEVIQSSVEVSLDGKVDTALAALQLDESVKTELMTLPMGTIVAYAVNEIMLDEGGGVKIIQDSHFRGKFITTLDRFDQGAQELAMGIEEDFQEVNENDLWSGLNEDVRGQSGWLNKLCYAPDIKDVCEINKAFENEYHDEAIIRATALTDRTKQLLHEMKIIVDDSTVELSKELSCVFAAIDELSEAQLESVLNLTRSEALAALEKVLKETLFITSAGITTLPSELYTGNGLQLLQQLNFKMHGEGLLLHDSDAAPVQCELIAARILIRALHEFTERCREDVDWRDTVAKHENDEVATINVDATVNSVASEDPNCTKKMIGHNGGEITVGDVTLHIPAGATEEPVLITVTNSCQQREERQQQIQDTGLNELFKAGMRVQLEPHGVHFAETLTLRLHGLCVASAQHIIVLHKDISSQHNFPWTDITRKVAPEKCGNDTIIIKLRSFCVVEIIKTMKVIAPIMTTALATGIAVGSTSHVIAVTAATVAVINVVLSLFNKLYCMCSFTVYRNRRDRFLKIICQSLDESQNNNHQSSSTAIADLCLKVVGHESSDSYVFNNDLLYFYLDKDCAVPIAEVAVSIQHCKDRGQQFIVPISDSGHQRHDVEQVTICRNGLQGDTICRISLTDSDVFESPPERIWVEVLGKFRTDLVEKIDVLNIIDCLFMHKVIDKTHKDYLCSEKAARKKMAKVIDVVISKGIREIEVFVGSLDCDYPATSSKLRERYNRTISQEKVEPETDPYHIDVQLEKAWEEVLQQNYCSLTQNLIIEDVIDDLYANNTVNARECETIRAKSTTSDRARKLIDIVASKGALAIEFFVKCLEKDYKYLTAELKPLFRTQLSKTQICTKECTLCH